MCWECYNCVKICPVQAVDVRGYADFVPMGASVVPLRSSDSIMWTVKFRNGTLKRFKFPIRTTPEGKAEPTGGFATKAGLEGPTLFTEPDSLGLAEVWAPKK
jgi:adenylylsulfate reductase subunit B